MKYRLLMKKGNKWLGGRIEYDTKELAEARATYFRNKGKLVKVVPNSYFGISK